MDSDIGVDATSPQVSDSTRAEMLAEWNGLRAEIIKRMEIRHQILSLALIVAGTLITFGAQPTTPVLVLLRYPLLSVFLALAWMHNDMRISEMAEFIREKIEPTLSGFRWEYYIRKKKTDEIKRNPLARATEISASGIFVFTELLALVLALARVSYAVHEILLVDLGAVFLTVFFVRRRRKLYRT